MSRRFGGPRRGARAVRAPQQTRSEQTMLRIVDAARQLLGERGFHALTLREVSEMADISQGTLHARFPTKAALVDFLHVHYCSGEMEKIVRFVEDDPVHGLPLRSKIATGIRMYLDSLSTHRGLARAFLQASCADPGILQRSRQLAHQQYVLLLGCIRDHVADQLGPGGEQRLEPMFRTLIGTVRDAYDHRGLFPNAARPSDDELVDQLTDLAVTALGIVEDGGS